MEHPSVRCSLTDISRSVADPFNVQAVLVDKEVVVITFARGQTGWVPIAVAGPKGQGAAR